tara:strand:+ start:2968 stop:3438 length:471 start_codon:yes stop_codon:yes gene_type:complete
MPEFKDTEGRQWNVNITVQDIKRVRELCDVDLMEAVEGKLLDRLSTDPILLVDTLFAIVQPQAEKREVSDEDFGRSMAGDAIETATVALIEGIIAFFPNPRDRQSMKKVYETTLRMMEKARDVIEHRLESGELEAVEAQLLEQLGQQSIGLPESAE